MKIICLAVIALAVLMLSPTKGICRGQVPPPPPFAGLGNAGDWLPSGSMFDFDHPHGIDLPGMGGSLGSTGGSSGSGGHGNEGDIEAEEITFYWGTKRGFSSGFDCVTSCPCMKINEQACLEGKPDPFDKYCFCFDNYEWDKMAKRWVVEGGICKKQTGSITGSGNTCCLPGEYCNRIKYGE